VDIDEFARLVEVHLVEQSSRPWSRPDLVVVADNGCGDSYGFAVRDGRCTPAIMRLDHETGTLEPTGHGDLLASLAA
jgi:hypothetical protein